MIEIGVFFRVKKIIVIVNYLAQCSYEHLSESTYAIVS